MYLGHEKSADDGNGVYILDTLHDQKVYEVNHQYDKSNVFLNLSQQYVDAFCTRDVVITSPLRNMWELEVSLLKKRNRMSADDLVGWFRFPKYFVKKPSCETIIRCSCLAMNPPIPIAACHRVGVAHHHRRKLCSYNKQIGVCNAINVLSSSCWCLHGSMPST